MYLRSIKIENIRSIEKFELNFKIGDYAGWHVVIGDNGSGKSTLVRSIALALVGPYESGALRQNWDEWLTKRKTLGKIELNIDHDSRIDKAKGKGGSVKKFYVPARVHFQRIRSDVLGSKVEISFPKKTVDSNRYIWGDNSGWFSSSYGPFRRFTGGDKSYEKLFHSHPKLASHLSAFGEDIALTECLEWLRMLQFKSLENSEEHSLVKDIRTFLNHGGLLPHGTCLDKITSESIIFRDGNGLEVCAEQLSDGYRSILSMTFEIIRQMVKSYGQDIVFRNIRNGNIVIDVAGVVIIDEIDAHLHPTWQQKIGGWMCKYFPKIQFIVTTHSPIVCQAAEKGTIWRLASPGGEIKSGQIDGVAKQRLIYGNILDAYSTDMFGASVTRSESSKQKMRRLAELNTKLMYETLNETELDELSTLKSTLPTASNVQTMEGKID